MTLSQAIAGWATGLTAADVPTDVRARFMLHVVDTLGCGFAAIRTETFTNVSTLPVPLSGRPGAPILGRDGNFVPEQAAFANGVLFHALDFDDTHGPAVLHPTAVSLPAAMAIGAEIGAPAEAVFLATLAGVEITCRIGMARHNAFHLKGFHPTSVVGTIGATVTAGLLLGLTATEMANALGIAGSLSCGIFAYLDGTSNPKPIHAGQAAKNGIEAARLAKAGVTGPDTLFESRFGLYGAFLGEADSPLAGLVGTLGDDWECAKLSIKPYPACHSMHACLDSALELQRKAGFTTGEIDGITVYLASARDINLVMEPMAVKVAPQSGTVGKFSLPYSMASLLQDGALGIDSYDPDQLLRPGVLSLARRIGYEQRDFETAGKALPGAVAIRLRSGEVLRAERLYERGGPAEPLSQDEILLKFVDNCGNQDAAEDPAARGMLALARREYGLALQEIPATRA
ncbi:MAG: MmgE/PrpD family protein [Rhodobacteraceae bacterium]|jgi:2-methylcitrate dehydratase PrpD|nr:MmgE/PrpD family protein [Paracoccaceae bacterium]